VFIDSHAHLEGKRYDVDREQVLARAKQHGIEAYLAIGNTTANRNIREYGPAWEFILMRQTSQTRPRIPKCCNGHGIPG
jgi:hypothetical protein